MYLRAAQKMSTPTRLMFCLVLGVVLSHLCPVRGSEVQAQTRQVAADGLTFRVPDDWIQEAPASSMRKAQFKIPAATDGAEDASLVVYYFGPDRGGSVEANVNRWEQQFTAPEGSSPQEAKKVETKQISGLTVTTLHLAGTYVAPISPRNPNVRHNKPDFTLFAAVVETTSGPFFFKMVGPTKTMNQQRAYFMQLIESLRFRGD